MPGREGAKGKGKDASKGKTAENVQGKKHQDLHAKTVQRQVEKGEIVSHKSVNEQISDAEIGKETKMVACTWEEAVQLQKAWAFQCDTEEARNKVVKVSLVITDEGAETPEDKGEQGAQRWVELEHKGMRKLWCLALAPKHGHPEWPHECLVEEEKLKTDQEEGEIVALSFIVPKDYVSEKEWKKCNFDPGPIVREVCPPGTQGRMYGWKVYLGRKRVRSRSSTTKELRRWQKKNKNQWRGGEEAASA